MKFMHLADLHLGRSILEQSLIEDQKYMLNELIEIVGLKKVDAILIAGDVYDKGVPSVEAVRLFSNFLARLYKMGVSVFVIAGNHDSKDRLSFGNELFIDNGVYIEGLFSGELKSYELEDEFGKVCIYMIPFVKPADVRGYYLDKEIDSYHDAVKVIIDSINIDKDNRNILLVHQFVTASGIEIERCDSEVISLGGIDNVDVSIFKDFDYVAMGHVHRGQKLIRNTIRYAGSPLKYSFSEVNHKKSVPIIEFREKGNVNIELIDLIPLRDMRVIKGKLDNLMSNEVVSLGDVNDYISAVITDDDYIMDAIGKLRSVYKNVLKLEYQNKRTEGNKDILFGVQSSEKMNPIDLFGDFYQKQNNVSLNDERLNIVNNVIKECLEKEV